MNTETQINNAVLWIEKLMTADKDGIRQGARSLGDEELGFCCLGYGCFVTSTPYDPEHASSGEFQKAVGLKDEMGMSSGYGRSCVAMNDRDGFTFSQIALQLNTFPYEYFEPSVAQRIKEHFA